MKTLNKFNTAIEGLFDALDKVRDALDSLEDEELDSLTNRFIDQVEECIIEGEVSSHDLQEFLIDYEQ